jgi:hypothetical protein
MSATEDYASFLRREFEGKRSGLLEIRRYMVFRPAREPSPDCG